MDSKISELDLVSVVDQNDVLPIVNGGITKKVKVSQLVQDLQSVTDKGATTTNEINFIGGIVTDNISTAGDVLTLEASNVQIILDDTASSVTVSGADFIANQSIGTPLVQAGQYRVPALNIAPVTPTSTGTLGEIRYTPGFIYVCIATNTWVRAGLATW
jgi:hypothetical protein